MDKKQASSIIKDAFGSVFDKDKFIGFVGNLLNLNSADYLHRNIGIYDAYKQHVQSLEVIAKFSDGKNEIDVLVVTLIKDTSLDKARTMQRNFVARYLIDKQGDAAIVAFTSPGAEDWRFSLIKMESSFKKTDTGIKVEEEFTPAKRWSFLVGKNENSHTAQSQLVGILANDEVAPTLDELEQAFSIETVTNEFFTKYTDLFLRMKEALDVLLENDPQLKSDFKDKEIDTADFAKKTMGQMAFLYFLQKKGWFGVAPDKEWGTGVKNFLREVFERREKYGENFFDNVLEPLFYEALAQNRSSDNDIYSKLNNCRMPFLNGGLFEPMNGYSWETTHIRLPDELFSNDTLTKEGDTGDGILDVFDRYNFTVNESEPLEQEVAVDPEMLGKVFENLLEIKDRKSKGAFYTPREIVHYMCQESLINYLETETNKLIPKIDIELFIQQGSQIIQNDKSIIEQGGDKGDLLLPKSISERAEELDDLLANIKVCDPAVGSGAFPLGMLNEIVTARTILGIHLRNNPSAYNLKLHAISNSIYGVDIDPGAVEIAKLRFWLSLVVEEDNPTPLPNLEHKIMQGNSLVSQYEGIELFDDDFLDGAESINDEKNEIQEKLNGIQKKYFSLHDAGEFTPARKVEIEKEIKQLQRRLKFLNNKNSTTTETGSLFDVPQVKKIAQKKAKLLQSKIAQYVTVDSKTNKENLKIEIDNLKWDLIEATLEERGETDKLDSIKKQRKDRVKPFFIWKLEFGEVFKNNGGFDVVIGNPPYIQLQKDNGRLANMLENCDYESFVRSGDIYCLFYELGNKILQNKGHLTFITSNKWMRVRYGENLRSYLSKSTTPKLLIDLGPGVFETATVDTNILIFQKNKSNVSCLACTVKHNLSKEGVVLSDYIKNHFIKIGKFSKDLWIILGDTERSLKEKIEKVGKPLKKWNIKINYGIKTGFNKAFIIGKKDFDKITKRDESSLEIIKPVLKGKNIKKYGIDPPDLWMIVTHNGYKEDGCYIPPIDIEKYPHVKEHLDIYRENLIERKDKGVTPYNLRNCAYYSEFDKEKIIYSEIVMAPQFYFDDGTIYPEASTFFITGEQIKFLIAVLNSKTFTYCFSKFYAGGGLGDKGYRYKKIFLESTPVPTGNQEIKERIVTLVDNIMKITSGDDYDYKNPSKEQKNIENKIDKLVFDLYELTPEEREIVLNS
ncbi:N-6 DNA methylase [Candidatus Woesearchaeota archaeon]|jgi:hypothetical protein|nr:N-6 DNA methylase [Candidatus Woesearchaeota archaeon]